MRAFTTLVFAARLVHYAMAKSRQRLTTILPLRSAAAQILNTYPRLSSEDKAYQPLSILSKRATSSPCGEVGKYWATKKMQY